MLRNEPHILKDDTALAVTGGTAFYETGIKTDIDIESSVVQVSLSAGGILSITEGTTDYALNSGNALVAGAGYVFGWVLERGKTYNLKSDTSGHARVLWVGEGTV